MVMDSVAGVGAASDGATPPSPMAENQSAAGPPIATLVEAGAAAI